VTQIAKADAPKYPVIIPGRMCSSDTAGAVYILTLIVALSLWFTYCVILRFHPSAQVFAVIVALVFTEFQRSLMRPAFRTRLYLKAKGLDIKDRYFAAIMPWDRLAKVELRMRSFNIIPNYVYFEFKDKSDVLILWDDVKETMDSTTLISCVRTWAPNAQIVGDAKLTRSESIATYTELWLKDMSAASLERRLREDQTLSPGTTLSNNSYAIERVLSGGGQGTAYLARVMATAEVHDMPPLVVIKEYILPANNRGLKKATDGLVKEVSIMRRIDHPFIVRLYDFFIEDMRGYFALEYVDGVNLRQLIEANGPINEKQTAQIGIALCDALSYIHRLSPPVIHGDVTPENIMLDKSHTVKLMDFDASAELTRNKTNTVVGKHCYMSPEQFKGDLSDSSDIYALGGTLYYLLTGFDPEPMTESRPRDVRSSVSEQISQIVSNATKLSVTERIGDLQQMRNQLEQI
jgi:Protein kinase domain